MSQPRNINESFSEEQIEFLKKVKDLSPWKTWRGFINGTAKAYQQHKTVWLFCFAEQVCTQHVKNERTGNYICQNCGALQ